MRNCKYCSKPFELPPSALNKVFCTSRCKDLWHSAERKEVAEELRSRRQVLAEQALQSLVGPPDTSTPDAALEEQKG